MREVPDNLLVFPYYLGHTSIKGSDTNSKRKCACYFNRCIKDLFFNIYFSLFGCSSLQHVSFKPWFSLDICPRVGLQGHMVALSLVFKGISILFSIVALPICTPTHSVEVFSLLHILHSIYYCRLFADGHSD